MQTPSFVVHLLSGGLDSTILLYDLIGQGCKVHCLLFDYKQRHAQELEFAKLHCHRMRALYTTIELPQLLGSQLTDGTGSEVVPFRNPIMLSLAANLAVSIGADSITIGCNKNDALQFPDCRPSAIDAFNQLLRATQTNVEVCAPYIERSKAWIARRGSDIGVQAHETWSCYAGGVKPCGMCMACRKRAEAFNE